MSISLYCKEAYQTAVDKGWHDKPREFGTVIALIHSELSEALEAARNHDHTDEHLPDEDPVVVELADACIRIFDYCGQMGLDLQGAIARKMTYNKSRPHRHGGKKF